MSRGAKVAGWAAMIAVLALGLEILSYAALRLVPTFGFFAYRPPTVTEADFATYLQDRHPTLGWPSASWLGDNTDDRGARLSPANAALGDTRPCISVYGDSFAFSDEVDAKDAWANVLADDLGCRVDNYGVGGFGTDQALLRFEGHLDQGRDPGDTVILTILPDNLNRNVNQWRYLLGSHPLSFKPAFRAGDGVALEPLFSGGLAAVHTIAADPSAHLPAETYAPGDPGLRRPQRMRFPYSLTLARIGLNHLRGYRAGAPDGRRFLANQPTYYDTPDGPSAQKLKVTAHILGRFAAACATPGRTCVLLLIPDPELVFQAGRDGTHDLDGWLRQAATGLTYLDATAMFADLDDICAHMTNPQGCNGHYSPAGYARLAGFVQDRLGLAGR